MCEQQLHLHWLLEVDDVSIYLIFRAWHSSLNEFVVRYLYIPLGGRKYQWATVHFININEIICLQVWLIFLYIGVWHDLMWRWISWSLLNCIFFSLENVVIIPFFFSARVGIIYFFLFITQACMVARQVVLETY